MKIEIEIQSMLNEYCCINRMYQLFEKEQLKSKFNFIDFEIFEIAWDYSCKKVKNFEIIKNSTELPVNLELEIENRVLEFYFNKININHYLKSRFIEKELNLTNEKIERRFRNIIALKHQNDLFEVIFILANKKKIKDKRESFITIFSLIFGFLILFTFFFGTRIRDGFTNIDELTFRIYEREIYDFDGSVCRDGTISHSSGRGTCSWHDGVKYKFKKGKHKKSIEECEKLAKELSWIGN